MKSTIRHLALELGFADCRFTSADPPASASRFQRWLASGRHGEMAYLQRNASKRVDPQQVLEGARTIITLAVSYGDRSTPKPQPATPNVQRSTFNVQRSTGALLAADNQQLSTVGPRSCDRPFQGVIARYARYADYHHVLGKQLEILTHRVNELGGDKTRSLCYVDTGPLLERDLAQRSGLGFIGKHTNLISRQLGNWIFLSEIITTLELEPDRSEANRCGSCARCLTACPTQAITAPFQLDARRCISYLTIESKGPIPIELRPAIGNRVYGCDDCLAACPWNRFAEEARLLRDHARTDLASPDLLELLSLDAAAFQRRFAGTPLLRAKRRGLLRNVCVALGNVGDESALPALHRATSDTEPLIAEHARWAIQRIEDRVSVGLSTLEPGSQVT